MRWWRPRAAVGEVAPDGARRAAMETRRRAGPVAEREGQAAAPGLRQELDWDALSPLRLRARALAGGLYAGGHRSVNRGDGVEFGGHREYVAGDDLRWLDPRAALRHGRLLVREFEAERQRTLGLLVDASGSMGFRSAETGATKLGYAALLAASLAYVASRSHDGVALGWFAGEHTVPLGRSFGRAAFDRVASALEGAAAGGAPRVTAAELAATVERMSGLARRGSVLYVFSDLVDLPEEALERITTLTTARRTLVVVQVLDPLEAHFSFDGPVELVALESAERVQIGGVGERARYLARLEAVRGAWSERLLARGGRLVPCTTSDPPLEVLRRLLAAAEGRGP